MIMKLKLLLEDVQQIKHLLSLVKQGKIQRIGAGYNGVVSQIGDEPYVFKKTNERAETEVASVIVGRESEFRTFIPVIYVNEEKNFFISKMAKPLLLPYVEMIDKFKDHFSKFAQQQETETSFFDYLDAEGARNTEPVLVNFLRNLQQDIIRTGIDELDLDIDFKSNNVMIYENRLVMIDW